MSPFATKMVHLIKTDMIKTGLNMTVLNLPNADKQVHAEVWLTSTESNTVIPISYYLLLLQAGYVCIAYLVPCMSTKT